MVHGAIKPNILNIFTKQNRLCIPYLFRRYLYFMSLPHLRVRTKYSLNEFAKFYVSIRTKGWSATADRPSITMVNQHDLSLMPFALC